MLLFITSSLIVLTIIISGAIWWRNSLLNLPEPSREIVQLTSEKRLMLIRLRNEGKFEPDDYYTGVATPEEEVIARAAVNGVLDEILLHEGGQIAAEAVSESIRKGMRRVRRLETEDRDRTADYMIEI